MRSLALLLPALLLAAPAAMAQQPSPPRWTFGALAIHRDAPYRGLDEDPLVVPLVRFEGERAYLRGLRGGVWLHRGEGFEASVFAQARLDGYDARDSAFLAGMADRDASLELGAAAAWRSKRWGQLELSVATDALDRSGGSEVGLSWNGSLRAAGWTLVPGLSLRWQDANLLDYYYGVEAAEALPGRPAYRAGSAVTPEASLLATRPLGARWTLFARLGHARLPSAITDSPLVDQDGQTSLVLGLGYSPD